MLHRSRVIFATLVFTLLTLLTAGSSPLAAQSLGKCRILPANNIWNTPIDKSPLDPNSTAYVNTIGAARPLHPDFGSGTSGGGPIGIPYVQVPGTQPNVKITFTDYGDESDPGPYPIPPNAPVEGGSASQGDRHVLAVDTDNCKLYELFNAFPDGTGGWKASSGAIFDLSSNKLRPAGWTSTDAAGFPVFPGLVRYDEVAAGEIRHAIRFTVPQTRKTYVWPATHFASRLTDAQYPPMGQRFRLKQSFDESGFSTEAKVIIRALKKYGMLLADNGSSWYISGAPDSRWDNDRLHDLSRIHGSDFEAIDESALMVSANSAQAKSGPRIVNAASSVEGPVSPGEIVTLYGDALGPDVSFDGVAAAILYSSSTQVNAVVPPSIAGHNQTTIQTGAASFTVQVAPTSPAFFTIDGSGAGQAAALNQDTSLNSAGHPAEKGSIVVLYATGAGVLDSGGDFPKPIAPVAVTIDSQPAILPYAGAAPGQTTGLLQINARIPPGVSSGLVPVMLSIGTAQSPPNVTIAIR
jgi:uncharacterized protein (TIGR03437 family)